MLDPATREGYEPGAVLVYSVAVLMPMLNALSMILASFASTSSDVQGSR